MEVFYKKWKKSNEIQLTKNKLDLNNLKMINHSPFPAGMNINQNDKQIHVVSRIQAAMRRVAIQPVF